MGISGVKYSRSYGAIFLGIISKHAAPFDNDTSISLSVSHSAMHVSKS